jgi:hypothetical protein
MFLGKKKPCSWQDSSEASEHMAREPGSHRHLDHALSGEKAQANLTKVPPTSHNFVALVDSSVNVLPTVQILHLQSQYSATAGQMKWDSNKGH